MKPSVAVSDSQHWVMWLYLLPQLSYQTSTWLQLLDITAASTVMEKAVWIASARRDRSERITPVMCATRSTTWLSQVASEFRQSNADTHPASTAHPSAPDENT